MDYSDKQRRTMADALQQGVLSQEALEFLRGPAQPSTVSQPVGSSHDANSRSIHPSHPGNLQATGLHPNGMAHDRPPANSVVIPGIVSMTFRIPARLASHLAAVAAERKLARQRPFSQQDIVAEALRQWFMRNGYGQ